MTSSEYVPGVCNINPAETAYRRKAGHLGVAIFVVLLVFTFATDVNRWWRISLFLPAFLAAIGYLQAKHHFCVSYAASGLQNATDGSDTPESITESAARKKDAQRARTMNLQAAGIALIAALVGVAV